MPFELEVSCGSASQHSATIEKRVRGAASLHCVPRDCPPVARRTASFVQRAHAGRTRQCRGQQGRGSRRFRSRGQGRAYLWCMSRALAGGFILEAGGFSALEALFGIAVVDMEGAPWAGKGGRRRGGASSAGTQCRQERWRADKGVPDSEEQYGRLWESCQS
jgi:hypothetical protein